MALARCYRWWCCAGVVFLLSAVPYGQTAHSLESEGNGQAIEAALDASVTLEFQEAPLSAVVDYLRGACQIPILIDRRALDDVGLNGDTPVTASLDGVSLRSALDLVLRELGLAYVVHEQVLQITNPSEAENRLMQRVYAVSDLMPAPRPSRLFCAPAERSDLIVDAVTAIVSPDSWDLVGGAGSLEVYRPWKMLAVSQSAERHAQIAALLAAVRTARQVQGAAPADGADRTPVVAVPEAQRSANDRLRQMLDADTTVEFSEAPLREVLDYLSRTHDIPIWIDRRALDSVGLNSDTPVTISLQGVPLRSALRLLLADLQLTCMVANELLVVTTPDEAAKHLTTVVYPVGDFLAPPGEPAGEGVSAATLDDLCQLVTATVQPDAWAEVGGAGNLVALDPWGLLVVAQTAEVHQQLVDLLQALRRSRAAALADGTAGNGVPEHTATDQGGTEVPTWVLTVYDLRGLPEDRVVHAIEGAVAPGTWGPAPGQGAIFSLGDQLLIRQTVAVHAEIRELLDVLQARGVHGQPGGMGAGGGMGGQGGFF